jgi:transcriptional regulator with XRE-family HTH domain
MELHKRLREVRKAKGLTMKQLSEEFGIPEKTISNYERNVRHPSIQYLQLLRIKFNANLNFIITGTGSLFDQDTDDKKDEYATLCNEIITSKYLREVVLKIIEAKKGNKEAIKDIKQVLLGIDLFCE